MINWFQTLLPNSNCAATPRVEEQQSQIIASQSQIINMLQSLTASAPAATPPTTEPIQPASTPAAAAPASAAAATVPVSAAGVVVSRDNTSAQPAKLADMEATEIFMLHGIPVGRCRLIASELKARLVSALKLNCDEPLSNFAFNFNGGRYLKELRTGAAVVPTGIDRRDWSRARKSITWFGSIARPEELAQLKAGAYTRPLFSST